MNKPLVARLYVNLSASQTRKRLKGRGLGVKRIEAEGRNQAVVSHTATGSHLDALCLLLEDVLLDGSPRSDHQPIENMRNLGPSSAAWLREAGIISEAQLRETGPLLAYRRVKIRFPSVSLNLLWAMVGALSNRDWREVSREEKKTLIRELEDD